MITLHNNYIFLPKAKKNTQPEILQKSDDVIRIEPEKNVVFYIRSIFGEPTSKTRNIGFFKMVYTYNIEKDDTEYSAIFTILNVLKYTYLDISLSRESNELSIQALEDIHKKITDSEIEKNYIMIISYDSISEYYCNKAYPQLNELERNLRRLLLNTYTLNFGTEYYQTTLNKELQEKIKGVIQAKGNQEKKKVEQLKKFFYSMEFADIQNLLFTKRWTLLEEENRNEFLRTNGNLSELSEEELRDAFERFLPKSDWERLFADKADCANIEELIEMVRLQRNDIAHCKFFYKEQYESFYEAANELNNYLIEAIRLTEEKDFMNKSTESLRIAMVGFADNLAQYQKRMQEIMKPSFEMIGYMASAINQSFSKGVSQ